MGMYIENRYPDDWTNHSWVHVDEEQFAGESHTCFNKRDLYNALPKIKK